ncbi:MAG: hypothetical protein WKG06_39015 [Segetibacter sp.]
MNLLTGWLISMKAVKGSAADLIEQGKAKATSVANALKNDAAGAVASELDHSIWSTGNSRRSSGNCRQGIILPIINFF